MKILLLITLLSQFVFANIGTISSLRGTVKIQRGDHAIVAKIGDIIQQNDAIKTGKYAKLQVILKDRTVITIGKSSVFEIEKYFYEKGNRESNTKIKMKKGFFKTITGRIGKLSPEKFKIKTKNSTIGIRGTQILSLLDPAKGIEHIACIKGSITVSDGARTSVVNVNQMVTLDKKTGMSPVKKMTSADRNKMNAGFKSKKKESKKESSSNGEKSSSKKSSKDEKESKSKEEKKADNGDSKEKSESGEESTEESEEEEKSEEDSAEESETEEPAEQEESESVEEAPIEEESAPEQISFEADLENEIVIDDINIAEDLTQIILDEFTEEVTNEVIDVVEEQIAQDMIDPSVDFEIPDTTATDETVSYDPF